MNIAIVDDEKIESETLEIFLRAYIKKFWSDCESKIHIEILHSAKEFLTYFNPTIYQLVVLGTRMQELARLIRAENSDVTIFFMNDCGEN